jgi:hypothetical protein
MLLTTGNQTVTTTDTAKNSSTGTSDVFDVTLSDTLPRRPVRVAHHVRGGFLRDHRDGRRDGNGHGVRLPACVG